MSGEAKPTSDRSTANSLTINPDIMDNLSASQDNSSYSELTSPSVPFGTTSSYLQEPPQTRWTPSAGIRSKETTQSSEQLIPVPPNPQYMCPESVKLEED